MAGPRRRAGTPEFRVGRRGLAAADPWLLAALVAVAAAAVLWLIVEPLARHTNDTDASATVLYFERIVHGQRLEAFVPTTPKPLLTIVYGLAWALTGDWRTLTVLAVIAGALAVGLAARLAARLGGLGAAAVAVVAMLAWPDFQLEVAHANSVVWALALWLLAAVLLTADRPRPWLAGIALAVAGLARTETVWLVVAASAYAAVAGLQALRGRGTADLRAALPLLLGWVAIPLACLHDLILTGRPFYWLGVPAGYTATAYPDLASVSPPTMLGHELVHYRPVLALLALAVAGGIWLLVSRRRAFALALASLAGGVMLTLIVLAWRAVYISTRYYEEADAPILLAAAIGAGVLIRLPFERLSIGRRAAPADGGSVAVAARSRWLTVAAPAAVALLLSLGTVALAVRGPGLSDTMRASTAGYSALETRVADLDRILAGSDGATVTVAGVEYPVADPAACRMFVPRALVATISVETGTPITALGDSTLAFRDGDYSELSAGQWVLHIAASDGSGGVYAPFERSAAGVLEVAGRFLRLVPVVADPQNGLWLIRVESAAAS